MLIFPLLSLLLQETGGQLKKFPMEGELNADNVKAHIEASLAGNLKPAFKSAEEPADNSGPVTIVVGKNFDKVVLDESKNVLLEIYAPW